MARLKTRSGQPAGVIATDSRTAGTCPSRATGAAQRVGSVTPLPARASRSLELGEKLAVDVMAKDRRDEWGTDPGDGPGGGLGDAALEALVFAQAERAGLGAAGDVRRQLDSPDQHPRAVLAPQVELGI